MSACLMTVRRDVDQGCCLLCAGRTICKLHLPAPGLHADINGDGVLDHIQAHGRV